MLMFALASFVITNTGAWSANFTTLDIGEQSQFVTGPGAPPIVAITIHTSTEWSDFWKRHTYGRDPVPPLPSVDFPREMVVAVMGGAVTKVPKVSLDNKF